MHGPAHAPFLLAAVMLRLNDWVPQVRQAADGAVRRIFATTPVPVILPAVVGMLSVRFQWQRGVTEAMAVDEIVERADVRAAMTTYLLQTPAGPVARTLSNLLRQAHFDGALPQLLQDAKHPAVRALALRTLLTGQARWPVGVRRQWIDQSTGISRRLPEFAVRPVMSPEAVESLVRRGAADKAAAVRKVAMQAIIDRPSDWHAFGDVIEKLNRDRSKPIREGMAYIARKSGSA